MERIPHIERVNGRQMLHVDGKPLILLGGEVHNSNSSSLEYMEQVWEQAKALNMNCLLLPVTWELTEPEEGKFDFSLVHGLIEQARRCQMKIAFLWFGTWKNAQSTYAPEWVRKDIDRFRRAQVEKGKNFILVKEFYNIPYTTLSYMCDETMQADARAFGMLMREIRRIDEDTHTVVAVQVENETGIMGAARDHSDEADAVFYAPVPAGFAAYMHEHTDTMTDSVKAAVLGGKKSGNWEEMFGSEAEEIFSAYHTAKYVNTVAEAGKKEYPLPLSVNCWLNKEGDPAGVYPSGGPLSRVREVWNYCAPAIDIYAPDIYLPTFEEICKEYTRRGEALYIPECATHSYAASRNLICIGKYHAMCYSPFGFEDMGLPLNASQMALFGADATDPALKKSQDIETYGKINNLLSGMMEKIVRQYGTENLAAGSGEFEETSSFVIDDVEIQTRYTENEGGCLILRDDKNEFYILAHHTWLNFVSADEGTPGIDVLAFEEGSFVNNEWQRGRRLNGDEVVGNTFTADEPVLLHVKVFTYC